MPAFKETVLAQIRIGRCNRRPADAQLRRQQSLSREAHADRQAAIEDQQPQRLLDLAIGGRTAGVAPASRPSAARARPRQSSCVIIGPLSQKWLYTSRPLYAELHGMTRRLIQLFLGPRPLRHFDGPDDPIQSWSRSMGRVSPGTVEAYRAQLRHDRQYRRARPSCCCGFRCASARASAPSPMSS